MSLVRRIGRKIVRIKVLLCLFAAILAVPGWSAEGAPALAASAPVCGRGDHGLLKGLQEKRMNADGSSLSFNDIQFLGAAIGRAAGNGFMIGTSDAGCTFQTIYEGQWSFRDIDFPDNVYGWALASVQEGQLVYLIRTTDGGSHWKRLSAGPVSFRKIQFTDRRHGFAYDWAFAYYTADGGASWSKIPTPSNTRGAVFTSRSSGWAVTVAPGTGYRVMKTVDGGTNWALKLKSAFSYPVGAEIYEGGSQVWALLYGESGMSQTSYSLYASADGGGKWRRVIAQSTAGGGPAPGSGNEGLAKGPVSGKPGNMQLAGGGAFLLGYSPAGDQVGVGRSYTGGKQWRNLPGLPGAGGVISFTGAKEGWLAVRGLEQSSLYATHDGGSTWERKLFFKTK
ncbi:photosystem II stability/assembly factor-like uncharacterized protein [Paenibacillus forsythiae]|uniref:Photosystem II stability/assembly factor-like uncharacterized protein n=1 Tax=Paenibacillus forsythiae TaxID=365616 RepID=A0ABU3HDX0_9BACL|nr:hypothetical protein [Paenibacillus forsythiae]MDT3429007.1 photosystem II stability/assembly factor-like uncharacterized protein [Paenibacillus forsythiae]